MKCKIFYFDLCQGLIIGDEEHTDFFMKIDGEDWFFCVGDFEPFDEWDDEETIGMLCKEYFADVKDNEKALRPHLMNL